MRPLDALPGDVKRKVRAMERAVVSDRATIVRQAANQAAEEQRFVVRSDTGGDMKLSGVGRRRGRPGGRAVGVRVRMAGDTAEVLASGPMPLIDRPVPPHMITSAYGRGRGAISGRRAVINIPGIGFRASAQHPGTRGKNTWARGKRQALPVADREIDRETTRRLTQAFRSGLG